MSISIYFIKSRNVFFYIMFLVLIYSLSFAAHAKTITCSPSTETGGNNYGQWSEYHIPFELSPSNVHVTTGSGLGDWAIIYTITRINIGVSSGGCSPKSGGQGDMSMNFSIINSPSIAGKQGNDIIYKTNTPGIGVSILQTVNNLGSMPTYPSVLYYANGENHGIGSWVTIKFWKIPGENIPVTNGVISVIGPEVAMLFMPHSGDNITSNDLGRVIGGNAAYIDGSRIIQATLMFQSGTCNIEGDNIRVDMGNYNADDKNSAPWKDARFKLVCPDGYGYGGTAHNDTGYKYPYGIGPNSGVSANSNKNGRVTISIVPYTEVIDANRGIIALDGTGAQGYGIQLAWGDYSSQNAVEPANPVILNSYVDANSLNSGFGAGDTPIGSNAFTGTDNTIKMAARYIRTTGDTAPGPANAVVQVIANYQ
ncbi:MULTISPECIES: fimbrial protein [Citrobacter]|uniref:fimbrial protein n=1 Tax=Citrobacter TaxID=544 RepID=UPI00137AB214|nr:MULTISPECIES: fimbrial protein [Citrobacter]MBD0826977.1 fimbrial protein [Citrobacter sp. C1]